MRNSEAASNEFFSSKSFWKPLLLLVFFSNFYLHKAEAQKLTFCENVNEKGIPEKANTVFTIPAEGGSLQVLATLRRPIEANNALMDIFFIDPQTKKEIFENTIRLKTELYWSWFKSEVTFYRAGEYVVYVYDERDKMLCAGKVKIEIN
ncbi:MAG: hypothetical protein DWQ44_02950 [Bacteroidetes bacterium]|nr:MAG: hypothetical protein DWQ39_14120 [Bacteroidota bacterium]REK35782.1 MAG: hypothetical protein DWQ44_02950 [Bacteroidota bacterium]REK49345.1 MAG: hypothetical protein DWQ48_07900 [Bacteroidota bacterium]